MSDSRDVHVMLSGAERLPRNRFLRGCVPLPRTHLPELVNDRELIGRVLAGDPGAERALYDAHVDRVFRLVYRMAGDADRAQDWVQETFIRAFDRLAGFRGESALSTWLCSIAISITLNGLRKVRRSREREVALDHASGVGTSPLRMIRSLAISNSCDLSASLNSVVIIPSYHDSPSPRAAAKMQRRPGPPA
jgi:RNA polymerase sigma factor (sigma-70 family)